MKKGQVVLLVVVAGIAAYFIYQTFFNKEKELSNQNKIPPAPKPTEDKPAPVDIYVPGGANPTPWKDRGLGVAGVGPIQLPNGIVITGIIYK